jgi:16S rRNA G527 N7-methylase RsmG
MLGLSNAEVVRGRLTAKTPLAIGRFEQIVTRATLPPAEAAGLLVPYLSPGGSLLLMTGPEKGAPREKARRRRPRLGDELAARR